MEDKVDPETLGARLAQANIHLNKTVDRQYEKIRKLENAIRKHLLDECKCTSPHGCLVALHKLIPQEPRPTRRQILEKARRR